MLQMSSTIALCTALIVPSVALAQARDTPEDGPFVAAFAEAEAARNAYWTGDLEATFQLTKPLAEAGNVVAQNLMGALLSDKGFARYDAQAALGWYEAAAGQGFGKATYNLATFHEEEHEGKPIDESAAMAAYQAGVDVNYLPSVLVLLRTRFFGEGELFDLDEGSALLAQAVAIDPDSPDVIYLQGEAAYYGLGEPEDYATALGHYVAAASLGHADAQFAAGYMFSYGQGTDVDDVIANQYFADAADQGHVAAHGFLAQSYYDGYAGEPNYPGAIAYAQAGAVLDDGLSLAILGDLHRYGQMPEGANYDAARAAYRQAADAGRVDAINDLSGMAYDGEGEPVDFEKAYALALEAAEAGSDGRGRYNVAYLQLFAKGTPRDIPAAIANYEISLKAGYESGYADMAVALGHPDYAGPHQDLPLAYAYCIKAGDILDFRSAPDFYYTTIPACDYLEATLTNAEKVDAVALANGL